MRVVDTSAWIEWMLASTTGMEVAPLLPDKSAWLVPTIVQLELAKWLARNVEEDRADQAIAFSLTCVDAPLTSEIALQAAELCIRNKLATADAIVYATALEHHADLVTCDRHFEGLDGVVLIAKR
jgi:predicted nucleic acid-binding protein